MTVLPRCRYDHDQGTVRADKRRSTGRAAKRPSPVTARLSGARSCRLILYASQFGSQARCARPLSPELAAVLDLLPPSPASSGAGGCRGKRLCGPIAVLPAVWPSG
jgi:hypothetical protein